MLQFHLIAVSLWMGLVAAETVMELSAKGEDQRRFAAAAHRNIDIYFEAPFFTAVLISGAVLFYQNWEGASLLLFVKVGLGLFAVAANIISMWFVLQRAQANDYATFKKLSKKISTTGLAVPLALLAYALGLYGV